MPAAKITPGGARVLSIRIGPNLHSRKLGWKWNRIDKGHCKHRGGVGRQTVYRKVDRQSIGKHTNRQADIQASSTAGKQTDSQPYRHTFIYECMPIDKQPVRHTVIDRKTDIGI